MAECIALRSEELRRMLPVLKAGDRVLLTGTILELERRARTDLSRAGDILPKIEHLKTLRAACDFNVGAGHLAGWLCAGNV